MRGQKLVTVLGSVLVTFTALVACGPSKPPADASNPPSDSTQEPSTKWDSSSETASNATTHSKAPAATDTAPAAPSTPTPTDSTMPTPPPAADNGPHLPAGFGGASYDREAAEVVLRRAARQVKANCGAATDEGGAANGPWGKTSVSVKMGRNGHSKSATIPAPYDGKPTGRCATQAFVNLQYPPFAGSDTNIDWEVEIVKAKAAK